MILKDFKIAKDNIALEQSEVYMDLHNSYDFSGFAYDVAHREVKLSWRRASGAWVSESLPEHICLTLAGVYLFKAKEREPAMPFTEDDCLDTIGFLWNQRVEEMGGYHSFEPKEDCTHMSLEFMSGFALKIGAESASLLTWNRA
jgi:hypothetical protein